MTALEFAAAMRGAIRHRFGLLRPRSQERLMTAARAVCDRCLGPPGLERLHRFVQRYPCLHAAASAVRDRDAPHALNFALVVRYSGRDRSLCACGS